jgi:hypothetical protein
MIGFGTEHIMNNTYEGIKENDRLAELLSQASKATKSITKELNPVSDYTGQLQQKKRATTTSLVGDRYQKRSVTANSHASFRQQTLKEAPPTDRSVRKQPDDYEEDLETRSVCNEIDYTKKDAARNIVRDSFRRKSFLRERVLKQVDGVITGKPLNKSDVASSLKSRYSKISARLSQK